jgi:Zn-dependent protease
MGWEDRDYYRDRGPRVTNPLQWMMYGQVPLFRAFGINVRAHASLVIFIGLVLLFGLGQGSTIADRIQTMTAVFGIVLLHEFGHCFTARWVGGQADEIVMHPLGGLAFARPPRRPLPTFLTVAGGPAVNVVICVVCGVALYFLTGGVPWDPFTFQVPKNLQWDSPGFETWRFWVGWLYWIYTVSLQLFLFNLLPFYPLDGGQMLQAILWPKMGYYRSMMLSCQIGMGGAVVVGLYGIVGGHLVLAVLAVMGFMTCLNLRRQLQAAGPFMAAEDEDTTDYSAAYEQPARPKPPSRTAVRRAAKVAEAERAEQQEIDQILAKVSATGMHSLTWGEKRALKRATENQRKRDQAKVAARKRSLGA